MKTQFTRDCCSAMIRFMRIFGLAAVLCSGFATAALAGGKASLLGDGTRAGVQIVLEPGWKTYWRMPGETGVAPRFDWSGSENLKRAQVLYPAPKRYIDAAGETVGFADGVVFPVVVEPLDAEKPILLRLKLDYGICKEICIPATAQLGVDLGRKDAESGAVLDRAQASLPKRLSSSAARIEVSPEGLHVALALADGLQVEDIFVEGAPLAYFRAPRAQASKNLILPVDGMQDETLLKGVSLTLTVTAGASSFEIPAQVE